MSHATNIISNNLPLFKGHLLQLFCVGNVAIITSTKYHGQYLRAVFVLQYDALPQQSDHRICHGELIP